MKKISVLLLSILTFGMTFTSCDMDIKPVHLIPADEYAQKPSEFQALRVNLYSPLRGFFSGGIVAMPDVMSDNFNAVFGFSNTWGEIYRWQFTSATGDFEGLFAAGYSNIGHCNYIIDSANKLTEEQLASFSKKDVKDINMVVGEAYFVRALMYFYMTQYYCEDYEDAIADEPDMGLSIVTTYNPTPAPAPRRATMRETFEQINNDLNKAEELVDAQLEDYRITASTITALKARVALATDNYDEAYKLSKSIIDSELYFLAEGYDIEDMWHDGYGGASEEFIFKLPIKKDEWAGGTGQIFLPQNPGISPMVDYIPSGSLLEMYSDNDLRKDVYFMDYPIKTTNGARAVVKLFNKYPDETQIYADFKPDGRFQNEPVVFRIAEMYLIAAESCAKTNRLQEGTDILNEFKATRFTKYEDMTFANADELLQEVKNERRREFAVEGTRFIDLKRWHDPIIRGDKVQDHTIMYFDGQPTTTNLYIKGGDLRFTWPIPQHEIDASAGNVKQNRAYL